MPLAKQNLSIPFAISLDTKTDPFQIAPDKMLAINNAVYTNDKKISKRNGFMPIASLPGDANATLLTTFNGSLTAVGNNFYAYNSESVQWLNKGFYQPIKLSVTSVVRSSLQQDQLDCAVNSVGLACMVFRDGGTTYKYQVFDSVTTQVFVNPVSLPSSAHLPKVFILGNYFIVSFLDNSVGNRLRYIAIPTGNPGSPLAVRDISTNVLNMTYGYDGYVLGSNLYLSWVGTDGGQSLRYTYIDDHLNQHVTLFTGGIAPSNISVYVDNTPNMWISYYETSTSQIHTMAVDGATLATVLAPHLLDTGITSTHITSTAQNNIVTVFYDVSNTYSYSSTRTDYIKSNTCTLSGTVGTASIIVRSVELGSKAFLVNGQSYILTAYQGQFQPTYFLVDGSGNMVAKLAYSNGGGYISVPTLPGISLNGTVAQMAYQFKDLLASVNKDNNSTSTSNIYSQTGANLATIDIRSTNIVAAEIGNNLHLTGGFLWMYDGSQSCEHGFQLWPEDLLITPHTSGGAMSDQDYFYQWVYEWTDSQGNIHRSAPSVSIKTTVSGGGGAGSTTSNIPTLRLTYKTQVRLVGYRASTAQASFYQFTSISSPTLNDKTVDSITYVDTLADSAILGNNLIYTTGGVVENIAAPACNTIALFKSRLMILNAEDPNVVWFSKQVIEAVPVETSDGFTVYVAPTISVQGSTGPVETLASLDDKFIFNKADAAYYMVGNGPDNTGASNDFSDPIFITATVGCSNQQSIAFIPSGLMFQSSKGIWLLGRDLSTSYIGAPVEFSNNSTVTSTVNPPTGNEIRFCLDDTTALMYDYFYGRWGVFENIPSLSSTMFQGLHTYLLSDMSVRQETPGQYTDNGRPVLMSFTTGWYNLAGLQGYERFYWMYILGQFLSPNKLQIQIAYDYNPSPSQSTIIQASNYSQPYGDDPLYGDGSPFGGPNPIERWRIFAQRQRCQAFQITVNELFDGTVSVEGAGLSFSGLNLIYGIKKGYRPTPAATSAG